MSTQLILAFVFGVVFVTLLFIVGCVIAFRKEASPIPAEAMFIFRVVLSLAAAGVGAILPGFLDIEGRILELSLRTGGALAVFFFVYRINPPTLFERRLPGPKKPVKHHVRSRSQREVNEQTTGVQDDSNSGS